VFPVWLSPAAAGPVLVVVVLDEVVVVGGVCWHTAIETVLPGAASAFAPGFWLSTWPFVAPLAHAGSGVALTLKPAFESVPVAAL
jgi:hypothetical protein